MGFQDDTFPLAIYDGIDIASRKLLWLGAWTNNREPRLIGRWYLEYLYEVKVIPLYLRMARGTETGVMATMHAFLRQHHGDIDQTETVIYGPSTDNQVSQSSCMAVYCIIPYILLLKIEPDDLQLYLKPS